MKESKVKIEIMGNFLRKKNKTNEISNDLRMTPEDAIKIILEMQGCLYKNEIIKIANDTGMWIFKDKEEFSDIFDKMKNDVIAKHWCKYRKEWLYELVQEN